MLHDSAYRKVRSISEGNFHSCYASNKAEKFKFKRLSQGLESCAQAQTMKLRKEEKELTKLYQNIQKEKMKHEIEQRHNQFYLKNSQKKHGKENQQLNSSMSSLKRLPSIPSDPRHKSQPSTADKRNRRCSLQPKLSPSNEVIPFYMQHGYSHYHNDPHYDHLMDVERKSKQDLSGDDIATLDEPSWKQKSTKLARLKTRRNAITSVNSEQLAFLRDLEGKRRSSIDSRISNASSRYADLDDMSSIDLTLSMNVNLQNNGTSTQRLLCDVLNKNAESQPQQQGTGNNSVLTPFERQELAKYQHRSVRTVTPMEEADRRAQHLFENSSRGQRRCTLPVTNTSKLNMLRHVLLKKLVNGESIKNLAVDKTFDGLLDELDDGRIYPAYDPENVLELEDFNALRKCKYLRISDLNKQSLNEIALGLLLVSDSKH